MAGARGLAAGLALALAGPAGAEPWRFATFNAELSRDGPGLLFRDAVKGEDDVAEAIARIAAAAPDVLALQGLDWDEGGLAIGAVVAALDAAGHPMPHVHAGLVNRGVPVTASGDLDGDGRTWEGDDMHGWARFAGQGSMAILSRYPLGEVVDLSGLLWADLPGARREGADGTDLLAGDYAALRLSTTAHWAVPVDLPGGRVTVAAHHATPPVFDGPEDRNGRRAADEAAVWGAWLDGALAGVPGGAPAPEGPVVLLMAANVDPEDGDGLGGAMRALLERPDLTDPAPRGAPRPAVADGHAGDPALDTVNWDDPPDGPGDLRVDYAIPSAGLRVVASGVEWPAEGAASRHAIVWVDVALP